MKFARHIFVLHHLATIPKPVATEGSRYQQSPVSREDANKAWDFLFTYIHDNWDLPEMARLRCGEDPITDFQKVEVYDCRVLLSFTTATEIEERLAQLPPYYSEALFPVAVARYMLRELALPFQHRHSATFHEFHKRYGSMILAY